MWWGDIHSARQRSMLPRSNDEVIQIGDEGVITDARDAESESQRLHPQSLIVSRLVQAPNRAAVSIQMSSALSKYHLSLK